MDYPAMPDWKLLDKLAEEYSAALICGYQRRLNPEKLLGAKISDLHLFSLLNHHRELEEEDAVEFSGIDLHDISLRGSQTAEIAAVLETETQPEPLKLPENHTTLESAVSYIFETAAAWFRDDAAAQDDSRIFTLDWKGLRMVLVATTPENWASFTTDSCAYRLPDSRLEMALSAALVRRKGRLDSFVVFNIDQPPPRYVGERLNTFLGRQRDAKEAHKILEEDVRKDTIARAASPGSVTKLFASKHTTYFGEVRTTSCGLLDSLSVTVGKIFRRTTYQVDGNGGFEIITRSRAPQDPSETKVTAEASVGFEGAQLVCGLGKVFQRRPYIRQRNDPAHNRIFTDIDLSSAVRRWFLSSLIKGNILVNKNSKADSFIPSHVMRATAGGILLNNPLPASYFSVLGGDLVSVGDYMFFRRHWTDSTPQLVKDIEEDCLILGAEKRKGAIAGADWVYYWSLHGWTVGQKTLESTTQESANSSRND